MNNMFLLMQFFIFFKLDNWNILLLKKLLNSLIYTIKNVSEKCKYFYCRLTPVYAFVIYYYATVFDHVGSGPMWKMVVSPEVQDCRKNWYLNLLYISNYIRDDHMVINYN